MKKLTSILMVLAIITTLSTTAFAAENSAVPYIETASGWAKTFIEQAIQDGWLTRARDASTVLTDGVYNRNITRYYVQFDGITIYCTAKIYCSPPVIYDFAVRR